MNILESRHSKYTPKIHKEEPGSDAGLHALDIHHKLK